MAPQRRALDRLAGLPARQGGGVQQPQPVPPRRRGHGQVADGQAEVVAGGAQALVVAGLAGQIREQVPSRSRANRSQWRSERAPSRTWATARQTSSASVSLGGRPGPSRGPSSSSMVTYSAMTRSSRQACTRPPRRSTLRQQRPLSAASSQLSPLNALTPIRNQPSSGAARRW